jgi:uncharacterized protein YecT (DUF1311 family)
MKKISESWLRLHLSSSIKSLITLIILFLSTNVAADIDCSTEKPVNYRQEVGCRAEALEKEYQTIIKKLNNEIEHLIPLQKKEEKAQELKLAQQQLITLQSKWVEYAHAYCYFASNQYSDTLTGTSKGPMDVQCYNTVMQTQIELLNKTYNEIHNTDEFLP